MCFLKTNVFLEKNVFLQKKRVCFLQKEKECVFFKTGRGSGKGRGEGVLEGWVFWEGGGGRRRGVSGQGEGGFWKRHFSQGGVASARSPVCCWFHSSFASTSDAHGTQRMASHRGTAKVVQRYPRASSAVGAVATGAEFPSASEGGARCVSRNTHEGFCRSPSFSDMQLLDAENPALVTLQEALKKAKASAPPLADRVSASEMYVAKKKKRLEEAEQEILEAIKFRDVLKAEVVAGGERLAGLKEELTRAASAPLRVPTDVGVSDVIAHLKGPVGCRRGGARCSFCGATHRQDKPQCPEPVRFAHGRTTSLPCRL